MDRIRCVTPIFMSSGNENKHPATPAFLLGPLSRSQHGKTGLKEDGSLRQEDLVHSSGSSLIFLMQQWVGNRELSPEMTGLQSSASSILGVDHKSGLLRYLEFVSQSIRERGLYWVGSKPQICLKVDLDIILG